MVTEEMDIPETLHRVRQLTGRPKRFSRYHNRADAERILEQHCKRAGLVPVYVGELD